MPFKTSFINIDDILNNFSLFRSNYVKNHSNVPAKSDLCLGTRAQVPAISGGLRVGLLDANGHSTGLASNRLCLDRR